MSFSYTKDMGLQLFYSKSHPCTDEEKGYITRFFAIVTNPQLPFDTKHNSLFNLVVINCQAKILSRLQKVCSCLKDLGASKDFGILDRSGKLQRESHQKPTQCDQYIRKYVDPAMFPNGSSLPQFLEKWFYHFLDTFEPNSSFVYQGEEVNISRTLHVCYLLVTDPETRKIIHPDLHYRLQKLGEYSAAIAGVIRLMGKFDSEAVSQLKVTEVSVYPLDSLNSIIFLQEKIIIQMIASPMTGVDMSGNFLVILDEYAKSTGSAGVTDRDLHNSFGRIRSLPVSLEDKISLHTHSCCFLGLALAEKFFATTTPIVLNIGTAKPICWLCLQYLDTIHHCYPHITIFTTRSDERIKSTWMLPPNTPSEVATKMHERLCTTLNSVITASVRDFDGSYYSLSETTFADSMQYWIAISKLPRFALKPSET